MILTTYYQYFFYYIAFKSEISSAETESKQGQMRQVTLGNSFPDAFTSTACNVSSLVIIYYNLWLSRCVLYNQKYNKSERIACKKVTDPIKNKFMVRVRVFYSAVIL